MHHQSHDQLLASKFCSSDNQELVLSKEHAAAFVCSRHVSRQKYNVACKIVDAVVDCSPTDIFSSSFMHHVDLGQSPPTADANQSDLVAYCTCHYTPTMRVICNEHAKIMTTNCQCTCFSRCLQQFQEHTQDLEVLFFKLLHILLPKLQACQETKASIYSGCGCSADTAQNRLPHRPAWVAFCS